jgi:hypothetical protein
LRRLVTTSKGQIELDVTDVLGLEVRAQTFDEDGWEQVDAKWKKGSGELSSFLMSAFGLPNEEADVIARQSLDQWHSRGGTEQDRIPKFGWIALFGVLGAPLLAAAAIVALIVVLIVWLT